MKLTETEEWAVRTIRNMAKEYNSDGDIAWSVVVTQLENYFKGSKEDVYDRVELVGYEDDSYDDNEDRLYGPGGDANFDGWESDDYLD